VLSSASSLMRVRFLLVPSFVGLAACTFADPDATDSGSGTGSASASASADESSTGDDEPHATLLADVPNTVCDEVGVVGVQIQAVQVGCEHPPPAPCTKPTDPPPQLGDMVSCPITDTNVTLGVEIDFAAEYQVSVVADRTPDDPSAECYAESTSETTVLVTSEDVDGGAQKLLVGLGSACPAE
jgi:hypothetical protein